MSKGLKYYSHYSNSHNHWKFKLLRKKFGWAGEGKFWALNNMIAESTDCTLDLNDDSKKEQIAADLEFEKEEFVEFLKYLSGKCRLVKNGDGKYTSDITQEDLQQWEKYRKFDKSRR